jgi:hypothetical protein
MCKKLGKIIKRLGISIKRYAKHLPLGQNMIKFRHDEPQMFHWKTCWKRYDGVDVAKWNLEVEPFVAR